MVLTPSCVFCGIAGGFEPAHIVFTSPDVIAFRPLRPVTPGHILVIPREHVQNAIEAPMVTAKVFKFAAQLAPYPCNLITSVGEEATQTVPHFHVHIVPRYKDDGLHLPWTPK